MKLCETITQITIHNDGDSPVFGESRTTVTMTDEAGGVFFLIEQDADVSAQPGIVRLDLDELEMVASAARKMAAQHGVE